jgi:hypothetical protein
VSGAVSDAEVARRGGLAQRYAARVARPAGGGGIGELADTAEARRYLLPDLLPAPHADVLVDTLAGDTRAGGARGTRRRGLAAGRARSTAGRGRLGDGSGTARKTGPGSGSRRRRWLIVVVGEQGAVDDVGQVPLEGA